MAIIPKIIVNTEAIFDICESEISPTIPAKINMIPMTQNCNAKRTDSAVILNANTTPTIIDSIPIIILNAVNPAKINIIPKNIKLTPMRRDNAAVPNIGKIIKINPKIRDNIPDILFDSIFFPPNFVIFRFFN